MWSVKAVSESFNRKELQVHVPICRHKEILGGHVGHSLRRCEGAPGRRLRVLGQSGKELVLILWVKKIGNVKQLWGMTSFDQQSWDESPRVEAIGHCPEA